MKKVSQNSLFSKRYLMLSLQRDSRLRNYYFTSDDNHDLILMEEISLSEENDHYTLFHSWEEALRDMNKFEDAINAGKRWWSYCPGWMYFNPAFIHKGLKKLLSKFIVQSLDDVPPSDVAGEEKERFRVWLDSCNLGNYAGLLN